MAATESQLEAGRRLARDLRTIRRKRGVDLKEVMDATRLADDVIEQLEESALIDHPAFNHVYLRSLFGVHASVLKVDRADMMQALEEVFSGHYVGSLAQKYLGAKEVSVIEGIDVDSVADANADEVADTDADSDADATSATPVEATIDAEKADAVKKSPGVEAEVGDAADPSGPAIDNEPDEGRSDEDQPQAMDEETPQAENTTSSDAKGHQYIRPEPSTPDGGAGVWSGLADRKTVLLPNMSGSAVLIIAGVAMIALIWFAVSWVVKLGDEEPVVVVQQDSTVVESIPLPEPIVLPDTFSVDIVAFVEALDPVRVTVDRDLRKPYWVEHLDQRRFLVSDRIRVEREVNHTRILVDGYALPQEWLDAEEPIEISRLRVQNWLDSLTTSGIVPRKETPTL